MPPVGADLSRLQSAKNPIQEFYTEGYGLVAAEQLGWHCACLACFVCSLDIRIPSHQLTWNLTERSNEHLPNSKVSSVNWWEARHFQFDPVASIAFSCFALRIAAAFDGDLLANVLRLMLGGGWTCPLFKHGSGQRASKRKESLVFQKALRSPERFFGMNSDPKLQASKGIYVPLAVIETAPAIPCNHVWTPCFTVVFAERGELWSARTGESSCTMQKLGCNMIQGIKISPA